jgi:uncharacterized protein with PIN domain
MLKRLGRYLRAAGYDTAIIEPGVSDDLTIQQAEEEDRILLTCDRELAGRVGHRAILLPSNGLDNAAQGLGRAVPINWHYAPFSRCLVDNNLVVPASDEDRQRLPPRARQVGGEVMLCEECGRLYWPGSHVRRMQAKLESWRVR